MPEVMNMKALSEAISTGIVAGNAVVVQSIASSSDKLHGLRNQVQDNTDKTYQLDREIISIKGMMTLLMGVGDGSSGMVPRLEGDLSSLKSELATVKSDVKEMKADVAAILSAQSSTKSFVDGWRGVAVAVGLLATFITIIGTLISGLVWLYGQHISAVAK